MSVNKESGVVSIFTVIFFMIFISVIIVGFVKIMGDESRQSADNDLTASALASAQSGAEEGKRLLLYCADASIPAASRDACTRALNSTSCNAFLGEGALTSALNIAVSNNEGVVTDNPNYLQRYTCMNIATDTPDISGIRVSDRQSKIIPLRGTAPFNTVEFSWHSTAPDKDGTPYGQPQNCNAANVISQPDWTSRRCPAMMRLEFVSHPNGAINIDALDGPTRTVFLAPHTTTGAAINLNSADPRAGDPNARPSAASPIATRCVATNPYACTTTISLAGLPPTANNAYYLRVTALYATTHIRTALFNGSNPVSFNNVQPVIDVTGRANDVFRRIQTTVEYTGDFFMPEYALESASPICKDMLVTDVNATSNDTCNP